MLSRRNFVATLCATVAIGSRAAPVNRASPRILFVCQFGSVKSAIARELLKRRAAELHVELEIGSRGITPEEHLPAQLKAKLLREQIDPAAEPLRQLQQADLDAADRVIIFDKLPAGFRASKAEDWTDVPSILNDYDKARVDLDRRIEGLVRDYRKS